MRVRVECRVGHRCERAPARFYLGRRRVEAVDVLDRWLSTDRRYFKVRGDDDATYILRHDVPTGDWELTLYDSANLRSALPALEHAPHSGAASRKPSERTQ